MKKDQIKKELKARGFDFRMLAEVLGKSPSLISKVASRQAKSQQVAEAIARALDSKVEDVFPDVSGYHTDPTDSPNQRSAKLQKLRRLLDDSE